MANIAGGLEVETYLMLILAHDPADSAALNLDALGNQKHAMERGTGQFTDKFLAAWHRGKAGSITLDSTALAEVMALIKQDKEPTSSAMKVGKVMSDKGELSAPSAGFLDAVAVNMHPCKPDVDMGPSSAPGLTNLSAAFASLVNNLLELFGPGGSLRKKYPDIICSNTADWANALAVNKSPQLHDGKMREDCLFPTADNKQDPDTFKARALVRRRCCETCDTRDI